MEGSDAGYVAAIDQGTTSTRCLLIDQDGHSVAGISWSTRSTFLPGMGQHDLWSLVQHASGRGGAMARASAEPRDIVAVGVTNRARRP